MDFCQARATTEATISQTGDGVRKRDARQARATIEALISQTGDKKNYFVVSLLSIL